MWRINHFYSSHKNVCLRGCFTVFREKLEEMSSHIKAFKDGCHQQSKSLNILWIGVVEVAVVGCCVVGVLIDATLIAVVDIDDVIPTEPLFCLLSNEDVLCIDVASYSVFHTD